MDVAQDGEQRPLEAEVGVSKAGHEYILVKADQVFDGASVGVEGAVICRTQPLLGSLSHELRETATAAVARRKGQQ